MGKLSNVMRKSLQAIADGGGTAFCLGGGWWGDRDLKRLEIAPEPDSLRDTVGTNTIYALWDRGMLERREMDERAHKDDYRITPAGKAALEEGNG